MKKSFLLKICLQFKKDGWILWKNEAVFSSQEEMVSWLNKVNDSENVTRVALHEYDSEECEWRETNLSVHSLFAYSIRENHTAENWILRHIDTIMRFTVLTEYVNKPHLKLNKLTETIYQIETFDTDSGETSHF